jgi:AraC family transcriptional regulator of adaptative response / DNA-3-methyladenine glycosylase II
MELDRLTCDRARRARDARFDGRFFIAVTTTRVYCRPICPVRAPKDEHVRYFPTAAAAEAAGFRPCLRCRPEASPGTPAWAGTSGIVSRALRLIGEGAIRGSSERACAGSCEELAGRLGVTSRHLHRLFVQHVGATPLQVALTRRMHFAKQLLDQTSVPIAQVAFASGFGSVRRFNSHVRRIYARTPTELRKLSRRTTARASAYVLRLACRRPYDWEAMLAFLAARATPGVEIVEASRYRRTIQANGHTGTIEVSRADEAAVDVSVQLPDSSCLLRVVERVRRLFDLSADPEAIGEHLGSDPRLREAWVRHPGIRVPGAWDGFELAVRAILGQQVSVRGATTIAGRVAAAFGTAVDAEQGLGRLFPTPAQLVSARLEDAGVMPSRADTIRRLARAILDDAIALDVCYDTGAALDALTSIPGIGPWTAAYVAMRALGEPDAFPAGDLVLRQRTGDNSAAALARRAERWRPWRAYAAMLLWQDSAAPARPHVEAEDAAPNDDRAPRVGTAGRGRAGVGGRGAEQRLHAR